MVSYLRLAFDPEAASADSGASRDIISATALNLSKSEALNSVPWQRYVGLVIKVVVVLVVVPNIIQLCWSVGLRSKHDAAYVPVNLIFIVAAALHLRGSMGTRFKENDEPDDIHHSSWASLMACPVLALFIFTCVLADALLYPVGYLAQVQWSYDRCELLCSVGVRDNCDVGELDEKVCEAERMKLDLNHSRAVWPLRVNESACRLHDPQILWLSSSNLGWASPQRLSLRQTGSDCARVMNTSLHHSLTGMANLHRLAEFASQLAIVERISKTELFGPAIGLVLLICFVSVIKAEHIKAHQVTLYRNRVMEQLKKDDAIEKVFSVVDAIGELFPKERRSIVTANMLGCTRALEHHRVESLDAEPNQRQWRRKCGLACIFVVLHCFTPGCYRVSPLHGSEYNGNGDMWKQLFNLFPFGGNNLWWLVMFKMIIAQAVILFLGYTWVYTAIESYELELAVFYSFDALFPLQNNYRHYADHTETLIGSRVLKLPSIAHSSYLQAPNREHSREQHVFGLSSIDSNIWLRVQELLLLSAIPPRVSLFINLVILMVWFLLILAIAISNFVLEEPKYKLYPADIVAITDFCFLGFLLFKGLRVYVQYETLKDDQLKALTSLVPSELPKEEPESQEFKSRRDERTRIMARIDELSPANEETMKAAGSYWTNDGIKLNEKVVTQIATGIFGICSLQMLRLVQRMTNLSLDNE